MADTCLSKWLRSLLQLAIPGNYTRRINYDSTTVNISVFIEQTNISFENDIFHWKPWDWECTLSWEKLRNRETQGRIVSLDQQLGVEEQFFIADLPGIMFITWTSDCGPVTPVKCTKSAHRGMGTIYDSCRFDIGRFRAEPTDLRKVSTSEWHICVSQCPQ